MPASNSEARKRHEANAATVEEAAALANFYEFVRGSSVHWVEPHSPDDYSDNGVQRP